MVPDYIDFKCQREALEISGRRLATEAYVSQPFLSNYEHGHDSDEYLVELLWKKLREYSDEMSKDEDAWMMCKLRYHMAMLKYGGEQERLESLLMIRNIADDMLACSEEGKDEEIC